MEKFDDIKTVFLFLTLFDEKGILINRKRYNRLELRVLLLLYLAKEDISFDLLYTLSGISKQKLADAVKKGISEGLIYDRFPNSDIGSKTFFCSPTQKNKIGAAVLEITGNRIALSKKIDILLKKY